MICTLRWSRSAGQCHRKRAPLPLLVLPPLGCQWLAFEESPYDFEWVAHDIGAKLGGKYDRIELLDLDGDAATRQLICKSVL